MAKAMRPFQAAICFGYLSRVFNNSFSASATCPCNSSNWARNKGMSGESGTDFSIVSSSFSSDFQFRSLGLLPGNVEEKQLQELDLARRVEPSALVDLFKVLQRVAVVPLPPRDFGQQLFRGTEEKGSMAKTRRSDSSSRSMSPKLQVTASQREDRAAWT